MSRFSDKVLVCRDCGNEFVFSAGEQEFYSTRGFNEPTRCPDCRQARKNARGNGTTSGFASTPRSQSYGAHDSSSSSRSAGTRQMYRVVCADCGQETEVPFEPRSGRPVYCRDCFDKRNGRR